VTVIEHDVNTNTAPFFTRFVISYAHFLWQQFKNDESIYMFHLELSIYNHTLLMLFGFLIDYLSCNRSG
jgi:hypothetical protein